MKLLTPSFLLPQILSLAVVCLWLLVGIRTFIDSVSGKMFYAPCVAEYEKERVQKELSMAGLAVDDSLVHPNSV
jgi:cytochrome c-type biogenesis protein CcmE